LNVSVNILGQSIRESSVIAMQAIRNISNLSEEARNFSQNTQTRIEDLLHTADTNLIDLRNLIHESHHGMRQFQKAPLSFLMGGKPVYDKIEISKNVCK
jgi:hypothetical protein